MTIEQQNKAWESLPEEAKVLARNLYQTSHTPQYETVLGLLFGESNLVAGSKPKSKFKVGDRMYIRYLKMIGTIDYVMGYNEEEDGIFYHLKVEPKGAASAREEWLKPYNEPTATEDKEKEQKQLRFPLGTKVYTIYGDGVVDKTIDGDIAVRLDDGGFCGLGSITAVKEDGDDWQSYRMELAAKIAVAMITATQSLDVERVMDVTDGIVERLKNCER